MIIYPDYKFAFQHVNRCGGTTIRKTLESTIGPYSSFSPPMGNMHQAMKVRFKRLKLKDIDIENYSIYANVRNPFHRLVSIYSFRSSKGRYKKKSFKDFFYSEYVEETSVPSGPISKMLLIDNYLPSNLKIVRLEDLTAKWPKIFYTHFNKKVTFPKLNSSSHSDPMLYFDQEMKKIVREKDEWVITNFYPTL